MTDPNKRTIYIQPETDAALKRIGGADRAKQIRRAVALAECAEDMAFWLRQAAVDAASQETEEEIYAILKKYRNIKQKS